MKAQNKTGYPLPAVKPEEAGFSAEKLARIGPFLQKYIDEKKVPNIVTLVARHGKLVYYDARGYMDFETKKKVKKDTLFRLYSNSKLIVGVATLILFEEGKLGLDDPVYRYIPSFRNQMVYVANPEKPEPDIRQPIRLVPAVRGFTIRDCLRNTTGLPTINNMPLIYLNLYKEALSDLGLYPGSAPGKTNLPDRAEAYAKLPLSFQPGTDFVYHIGYPVLSVVLEKAAGKPLDEFYRERIFEPLGMKDTSFYVPQDKIARFPTCYIPKRIDGEYKLAVNDTPENSFKVKGPKSVFDVGGSFGGNISTIADYARFSQMLLNRGELDGARIISRKSVEMMVANHIGDIHNTITGRGFGFGLGVSQYLGGAVRPVLRSVGTFHWGGAAGTASFMDPKEDLLGLCFTQVLQHHMMPANFYQEDFERLVYQALL